MKIGILSMQRIRNYGSFLQAYSLKKNVELLGHDVQFVDYKVESAINKPASTNNKKSIMDVLTFLRRRIYKTRNEKLFLARKEFKKRYDTEFFDMLGLTREANYTPKLDTLVIGSDEVFNCLQTNTDVGYSKQLFGAENNANKLISYAASFGNTTKERLDEYGLTEEISDMLGKFNAFSVRDKNTESIIRTLTDKEPVVHLDPVFIYDYPEVNDIEISLSDYIVVYAYTKRIKENEAKKIKEFAKKHNKKIVCIGEYQDFCDEYISANPFELLAYIRNADYVVTDTFHGTVFSIKFNKAFATIMRHTKNGSYGNFEKLSYLLAKFKLNHRQVENIENLEEILLTSIDFTEANQIISDEKERSVAYLKENL